MENVIFCAVKVSPEVIPGNHLTKDIPYSFVQSSWPFHFAGFHFSAFDFFWGKQPLE